MSSIIKSAHLILRANRLAPAKANQLYLNQNINRWGKTEIFPEQIQSVWKQAYKILSGNHPRISWLKRLDKKPKYLSKLEYVAGRGGKDMLLELCEILINLGGVSLSSMPADIPMPTDFSDYIL